MNMRRLAGYCAVSAALLFLVGAASAQNPSSTPLKPYQLNRQKAVQSSSQRMDPLRQFNDSLQELAAKVSPAVVQVLVRGYGPVQNQDGGNTALIARQQTLGSGVIVDPDG